jgi:GNAT superfamily N-acetyltransferase
VIRPVTEADWDRWRPLWNGYLDFYREDLAEETSRLTFSRLCERNDEMFGFVAEDGGELTGLVHALTHRSTWAATSYCYLEDLFVAPAGRGTGVARRLIEAVTDEASRRGSEKVYWHTQEFNGPARSLYDQLAQRVSIVVYERATARAPRP